MDADRSYVNKRCPKCGWRTFSFISFNYVYCPMCASKLEEFDMRSEIKEVKYEEKVDSNVKYARRVSRSLGVPVLED